MSVSHLAPPYPTSCSLLHVSCRPRPGRHYFRKASFAGHACRPARRIQRCYHHDQGHKCSIFQVARHKGGHKRSEGINSKTRLSLGLFHGFGVYPKKPLSKLWHSRLTGTHRAKAQSPADLLGSCQVKPLDGGTTGTLWKSHRTGLVLDP